MFVQNKNKMGLTLIELLVVMAILGILASFTSVVMIGRQKQARDAQRKSDLQQIKRAMQSAKNDCKAAAYYPYPSANDITLGKYAYNDLISDLILAKYISRDINDPQMKLPKPTPWATWSGAAYEYYADYETFWANSGIGQPATTYCPSLTGGSYKTVYATETFFLRAKLENSQDPDIAKSFNNCPKLAVDQNGAVGIAGAFYTGGAVQPTTGDGYYYVCSN